MIDMWGGELWVVRGVILSPHAIVKNGKKSDEEYGNDSPSSPNSPASDGTAGLKHSERSGAYRRPHPKRGLGPITLCEPCRNLRVNRAKYSVRGDHTTGCRLSPRAPSEKQNVTGSWCLVTRRSPAAFEGVSREERAHEAAGYCGDILDLELHAVGGTARAEFPHGGAL